MSKKIKVLSQDDIKKCLDMFSAINAAKIAFSELSKGNVTVPLRTSLTLDSKDSGALFMPVYFPVKNLVGLKSVMINKNNPLNDVPMIKAMYYVFDATSGEPIAIMDGKYLTAMRTGAATGLATDLLSDTEAEIAVILGAGIQAEKQIEGISVVRNLKKIYVYDINEKRVNKLITSMKHNINAEIVSFDDRNIISEADIICAATSSSTPVLIYSEIKNDVHINGIGSYRPDMCEIDQEIIVNSKLYVDERKACLKEAGDIVQPINANSITANHIYAEIGEVINGNKKGRIHGDNITVFKSVGNAIQDIVAAAVILENSEKLSIGSTIKL